LRIKHIIKYLFLIVIFATVSCSKKIIAGKYRTNFNTYGMFSKTLILECNGNAILNFQGDMQNNNSIGIWKTEKDTLKIYFDSLKNVKNKFKGELKLLIKKRKLENMPFPKSKYNEMVRLSKEIDTLKMPSYRKVNRIVNKTPKNFLGKNSKQYFEKIEDLDCK
jgi:hypothetical protein